MKRINHPLGFVSIGLLLNSFANAGTPVWTLTPSTQYPPTQTISATETITVQYIVQNQSRKVHHLQMQPIKRASVSGCEDSLIYKQSCVLNLSIAGSALQGDLIGGPILCQTSKKQGNANQCYQPSAADQLHITRSTTPPASTIFTAVGAYSLDGNIFFPLSYVSEDNGQTWELKTTFAEPENLGISLNGVSCVDPSICVATGTFKDTTDNFNLISYFSNDNGKSWTYVDAFSLPSGDNFLLVNVSCLKNGNCITVGGYNPSSSERNSLGYKSIDFGQTWDLITFPTPSMPDSRELRGISCLDNGVCVAVGDINEGTLPLAYFSTNFGQTWTESTIGLLASNTRLLSVSCFNNNYCAAVGVVDEINPAVFLSKNGGKDWSATNVQVAPPVFLTSVSCVNDGQCAAVGLTIKGLDLVTLNIVSSDFGNNWTVSNTQPSLPIPNTLSSLPKIFCKESKSCVVIADSDTFTPISYRSTDLGNNWLISLINPPPLAMSSMMGNVS